MFLGNRRHVCGECGHETYKNAFACSSCGLEVELPVEEKQSAFNLPTPPPGWVSVADRNSYERMLIFCSWGCVEARAREMQAEKVAA